MLDSPVTGGTEGAAAGTLILMVGGKAETFEKAKPLLKILGSEVMHLGRHGAGCVAGRAVGFGQF